MSHPYRPPLLRYTREDRAAKGLRRAPAAPPVPEHLSALEMVAELPRLMLLAPQGGGRTRFARHLLAHLPGNPAGLRRPVPRNEDGALAEEAWHGPAPRPLLHDADADPAAMPAPPPPGGLLILDHLEAWGPAGPARLAALLAALPPEARLLALGEARACAGWAPPDLPCFTLLPLLRAQRAGLPAPLADDPMLGHAGLLSLALDLGMSAATPAALGARWLEARAAPARLDAWAATMAAGAPAPPGAPAGRFLRAHLVARAARDWPSARLAALFQADPDAWAGVLRLLAQESGAAAPLAQALLQGAGPRGTVLAAEIAGEAPGLPDALAAAIAEEALSLPERFLAGRQLARLGDPRDLAELVPVPGGVLCMGASAQPGAMPEHRVPLAAFRIGRFPVGNALYARFAAATGRPWHSATGRDPALANAPATDLSWHDAQAFCAWLTPLWRAERRIGPTDRLRLPSEAEWEYAARGARPFHPGPVHPWGTAWRADAANAAGAGLNDRCAAGLFPAGRSPFGCEDMAGQVWEWCSTLWGEDMARPAFPYPYDPTDGREAAEAPPGWRRVLRGGCFSSGPDKANCHYRGALEPAGFWRGNGFRVAVSG